MASGEQRKSDILVIGAGVVGIATAINLQKAGRSVTVVDRSGPGDGASFGNAGVLASSSIIPVTVPGLLRKLPKMLTDPLGPVYLRWRKLPGMVPWLLRYLRHGSADKVSHIAAHLATLTADSLAEHQGLAAGTAAAQRIKVMPYRHVFADRATFEADKLAWDLRRQHGITWDIAEGDAVREQEPHLARRYGCLVNLRDQHGAIDHPGDYIKELAAAFQADGGEILQAQVTGFLRDGDAVTGVLTDDGDIAADWVIVAAGAWSARLLKSVGLDIPLEAERGYHVELRKPSKKPNGALMIADGKFVATPMGENLRIAGLVEFGGLDLGPNPAPIRTLKKRLEIVFPGIEYEDSSDWLGHRPATTDSLPVLGPAASHRGLVMAFGHHHVGLTCGPKTGRLVADMVLGKRLNVDMGPFDVARFT